jgi:hypothetical protein
VDETAFDRLTRQFGAAKSRRGTLSAVLGLVLGGALVGRGPDALAHDRDRELAAEAIAGGRGSLAGVGGRRGARRRRNRQRDHRKRHRDHHKRRHRGQDKTKSNDENKNSCAKSGQKRKPGKPCCRGLERGRHDRCTKPATASTCVDDASCPADESTVSTGPGKCCETGYCSCGGECCDGPDCWIVTTQVSGGDERIVHESCTRPDNGCLQCNNSDGRCCEDCTKGGDCLPLCIECPGQPSAGVCCSECIDETTKCAQPPDNTPISGGIIRRR